MNIETFDFSKCTPYWLINAWADKKDSLSPLAAHGAFLHHKKQAFYSYIISTVLFIISSSTLYVLLFCGTYTAGATEILRTIGILTGLAAVIFLTIGYCHEKMKKNYIPIVERFISDWIKVTELIPALYLNLSKIDKPNLISFVRKVLEGYAKSEEQKFEDWYKSWEPFGLVEKNKGYYKQTLASEW